jgi:hypothetical protein
MAWNADSSRRAVNRRSTLAYAAATEAPATPTTPRYALSAPFNEIRVAGPGVPWAGEHRFGDVFCLRFPDPSDSTALAETMFNDNTLYFSRLEYPNRRLNLYVVTSRLPAGLDRDGEHVAQRAIARQYVAQIPTHTDAGDADRPRSQRGSAPAKRPAR